MYRRVILMLYFFFLFLLPVQVHASKLLGPIYPDSVQSSSENPRWYLSKDAYEQVKAHYKRSCQKPVQERVVDGSRVAFFEYMSVTEVQKYDPVGSAIGVVVYERSRRQSKVADALGNLQGMMQNGMLSEPEYNRLVEEYDPVCGWFFPQSEDTGEYLDLDIYARYEKGPAEQALQQDTEAMAKKVQALMQQGKQQEAMQLMQQMGQAVQEHHSEVGIGQAGVDKWKECLAEMKSKGYRTRIEHAFHPAAVAEE